MTLVRENKSVVQMDVGIHVWPLYQLVSNIKILFE